VSADQRDFDAERLRLFYALFDDATTVACLSGRPWCNVGAELIDVGPLNSFFFSYEGGGPVQLYLDQVSGTPAFLTEEHISEALGYVKGYVAGARSQVSQQEAEGLEERLGVLWLDDGRGYRLVEGSATDALTVNQFRVLNEQLLGLIHKIKRGHFAVQRVEWPPEEVYRKTRVLDLIPVQGVFELKFA